ncbi:hypothetical protein [Flavobacterium sp.]|uniref:hypothetical protein n=1 Tax=Flavobacterium sp. TaxID=239 RepID=UPI002618655B|nr:hypothetical protein [Flavobacterium sp.]
MKKTLLLTVLFLMNIGTIKAQGCSDAGICSVGNSFQDIEKAPKNSLEFGSIFGAGEADVKYFSPYVTYTRQWNAQFALSTKVTYSLASGNFGKRGQFGDAYLIGNYLWKTKKTTKWSTLFGAKFPFTRSNLKINGYSLPLDYQASLGTFDLILGTNLNYKNWDFNAGLQLPVFNINSNSYFKEYSGTDDFPSTNLFRRKPDALFRTTYTYQTHDKKWSFKPNVLFLYHLGEDSFESIFGKRENIEGSDGLTINGNLIGAYHFNKNNALEFTVATPFVVRDIRPDGLTRSFTAGVIYKIRF